MRLYVANMTKQNHDFCYRIPEQNGLKIQSIPIGGQVMIGHPQLNQLDVNAIILQHEPYGLIAFNDLPKHKEYIGLCYSIDKPVPVGKILLGVSQNMDLLIERGRKTRIMAGHVVKENLENSLGETGRPEHLRVVDMTTVEEEPKGGYRTENPVGEQILFDTNRAPTERPRRRSRA